MPHKVTYLILIILSVLIASPISAEDITASDITVLFSPGDECGKVILNKINSAEKSIDLAIYHITSRELSLALIAAVKRGIMVRAYIDGENAQEYYSKANFLKKNGVLVKFEEGEGLMHNKFCIIDDKLVITGSYNWTTSADLRNDENVLFIDSKDMAKIFRIQFEKYWQGNYIDKALYIDKYSLQKRPVLK